MNAIWDSYLSLLAGEQTTPDESPLLDNEGLPADSTPDHHRTQGIKPKESLIMTVKERWADRTYRPFHRKWPKTARRATAWLMLVELIGLVPILVIFGLAQPDLYRTDLWRIGFEHKLNSNPNMILYAYANYQPQPNVPLIWSRT